MGLLSKGTPLDWKNTKLHADLLRKQGIKEFLNIYKQYKLNQNDSFKWGDEIEFTLIKFDHVNKKAHLLLKADQLLNEFGEEKDNLTKLNVTFQPEYAAYMIESTPSEPFDDDLVKSFDLLEDNMLLRRKLVNAKLEKDEYILALTSYPRLGCDNFTYPNFKPTPHDSNSITRSLFYPDQAIFSGHPRFATLSKNIRKRRNNRKVGIYLPIYKDEKTQSPFIEDLTKYSSLLHQDQIITNGCVNNLDSLVKEDIREGYVFLDATGFGMGCCCLQTTFQAESIDDARYLYDQLTPFTPLLLALSASSPIWRGYLTQVDCRWNVISGSVDDRTRQEMGLEPLKTDKYLIPKSRYDSIDSYLSEQGAKYNDIDLVKDEEIYQNLLNNNIDPLLAQHIAHLFIRDPIVLFKEKLESILDNSKNNNEQSNNDNFENIQSTNWQSMRFKPPPPNSNIGWRIEFRTIELQFTEYENAAFCFLVILLTRAIKKYSLNFLMKISKVDENIQRAQLLNAYKTEKFYFRQNINDNEECNLVEMTLNDIFNGNSSINFKGILPILHQYLDELNLDQNTRTKFNRYLDLFKQRSNNQLMTPANYMRNFVLSHPKYKQDSVVTDEINYDLLWRIYQIQSGQIKCPELINY